MQILTGYVERDTRLFTVAKIIARHTEQLDLIVAQ